jgi:hypothetical protein
MLRLLAILGGLTVVLSACAGTHARQVIALPNGYYLEPNQKGQTELVKRSGHTVVPAPIAAYSVAGEIVAGALGGAMPEGRSYANDLPFHGGSDTRYFVLDTRSGRLDQGLDDAAWHKRLEELGAPHSLEIYPPLAWQ